MSDSDIKKDELLQEPSQDSIVVDNVDGIVEPIEVDDELLAEIEAIQALVEEGEEQVEVVETAAGESSDGGSSSAVNFARDGTQTLASTDFKTAGFSFSTASVEFTDTNNTLFASPTPSTIITSDNRLNAQFTDNFVSGVKYTTSSGLSGFTGDSGMAGEFKYNSGDTIIFTVGDVVIGEFSANVIQGNVLFLQDIAGNSLSDNNSNYVENMAIFLQALDDDLSDSNNNDDLLKTDDIVNNDTSYTTNINISEAMHDAFTGYTDPTMGIVLNIANSGKEMISQALASVGVEFTRDSERDDNGENVFESIAMAHVAETIQDLAGEDRGPVIADARQVDTIDVPGGLINFNFKEADGVITFTTDDLLKGAVGQQVITENLVVKNVTLSAAFENIGTLVDKDDGNYEIQLNEGVTGKELENLSVDYRVEDWTVIKEVTSQTLDSYKSHLSADIPDVVEDAGFNQFTLNSTLIFEQNSLLQINFTSELLSKQLTNQIGEELAALGKEVVADEDGIIQVAEYADDYLVPLEYSNDGGITWIAMNVVALDITGSIPRPIFGFELGAGDNSVEIRVPIFDDVQIEPTEYFRSEIKGDNFYDETILFSIIDNDLVEPELPTIDIDYVLVTEGQGEAVFTLTLNKPSDKVITVDYSTTELSALHGEDFIASSGTVTFQPRQTTATISIPIVDDLITEISPEFALVNLSNASNAIIDDAQGTLRIFDNDFPVEINVNSVEVTEGEQAVFTVSFDKDLGENPDAATIVNLSLIDGSATSATDYNSSSLKVYYGEESNPQYLSFDDRGNVIVPIGVTTLTVIVDTTDDSVNELTEVFELVVKIANEEVSSNATIIDNDNPTLTVVGESVQEGGVANFTVTLSGESEASVMLNLTPSTTGSGDSAEADDISAVPVVTYLNSQGSPMLVNVNNDGSYTFPGSVTAINVAVQTTQDSVYEGPETFSLIVTDVNNVIESTTGTSTIVDNNTPTDPEDPIDNDIPTLTVVGESVQEGNVANFAVTLSGESEAPVMLNLTPSTTSGGDSAEANDITALPVVTYVDENSITVTVTANNDGSYTFPGSVIAINVAVQTTQDSVYEGPETFSLIATDVNNIIADASGTSTILDNNSPTPEDPEDPVDNDIPTLTVVGESVQEGNVANFAVTLSGESE
ncbi:Calx-beta domain-containing protein, partial [Psychromonas marina]